MTDAAQTTAATSTNPETKPLSPEYLCEWREAAASGGLPEPTRHDRWQQLRAGVVNMWEFEVAEFWMSDGRAQLMGHNETGKSTLMTLTTLIMLAGSTATHLIDTLGDGRKRFRYYVEPTESDKDRRDASKSVNRGWVWVEYGRLTPTGPQYATALLHAEARRPKPGRPQPTWAVCEGPDRVRRGLVLIKGSTTVPPSDLESNPGWRRCDTGEAYKQRLAEIVFDGDEHALDSYVRMLRVIRTPKLGERLDQKFLSEQLRMAFPPLREHEIHQLADGWDQLEKITNDRDSAQQARDALSDFNRRAWHPWASATVRHAADNVAGASSALDEITRRERVQGARKEKADKELGDLDAEARREEEFQTALRTEREEIQRRDAYVDAQSAQERARSLAGEAERVGAEAARQADHAQVVRGEAEQAKTEAAGLHTGVAEHEQKIQADAEETARLAAMAGISEAVCQWINDGDDARPQAAYDSRRGQLAHLRELLGKLRSAQHRVEVGSEAVKTRKDADSQAEGELTSGLDTAATERQRVVDAIGQWAVSVPAPWPSGQDMQRWADAVNELDQHQPAPVLRQLIDRDFITPRREELITAKTAAQTAAKSLRAEGAELSAEIKQLESQPDVAPTAPQSWTRRTRPAYPSALGAPLWRLIDPHESLPAEQLAVIEAALAAAGLLDAWVTPDGVWSESRDGADVVATIGNARSAGPTLARVLRPAADCGNLAVTVTAVLSSISWIGDGQNPADGYFIAADGRWRSASVHGLVKPAAKAACYIGTAARRMWREQRIAELTDQRAKLCSAAEEFEAKEKEAARQVEQLREAVTRAPDDSNLAYLLRTVVDAKERKEKAASKLFAAQEKFNEADCLAAEARREVSSWRDEHQLPQSDTQLDVLSKQLEAVGERLRNLRNERKLLTGERGAADRASAIAVREMGRGTEEKDKADRLKGRAERLKVQARTAREALSKDAQNLLARVQEIDTLIEQQIEAAGERAKSRTLHVEERAAAGAALATIERERTDALTERETATRLWWRTVDSGLPEALELPDLDTRTTTAALDHARAARASIPLPDWPERDAHAQRARIQRTWRKLAEETTQLRSILEVSAGRTVRIIETDDDEQLPAVEAVIDSSGIGYGPREALVRLAQQHEVLQQGYDRAWHDTLDELLGSAFIEHLRDRLETVHELEKTINDTLAQHPTGTSRTTLRIRRVPLDTDSHGADVLDALSEDFELLTEEAQEQIQFFLRSRVEEAQQQAKADGETDWRARLADALDYRRWFSVVIDSRTGSGRWTTLERGDHEEFSGGARVVTLMLPLVAALATMYQGTPTGPRPLWLDEAFDGVDAPNRSSVLGLLREFDMDYLLAGPGPLVTTATVPSAAMYQVVRAPHPLPGADLTLMLWAAGRMEPIELPDPAHLAARAAAAEGTDPMPDLFSVVEAPGNE
ncbi:TIGR02680 family protein [Streptomyces lunaelactis]|uniref:TIGR02680 family protein n=1 Tax=Streptomyces lunaelactis TaxID=1535768 RepID=UPI0015847541|nr:TIGR02680 family protein [Streptomyces lunaelactis]NUK32292.1 TIGR02680 family protein [Streptomyces lunaelactis]